MSHNASCPATIGSPLPDAILIQPSSASLPGAYSNFHSNKLAASTVPVTNIEPIKLSPSVGSEIFTLGNFDI